MPYRQRFDQLQLLLSFASEQLSHATLRTQHELTDFLRRSSADLITIPGDEQRYSARIRGQLLHQQGSTLHCPPFEALAAQFSVSAQTLRRRLMREGTSYPQIKDEIRRDLAIEKPTRQKLSIAEIAEQLGFSEARSFSRAFKQWTGLTPSAYLQSTDPGKRTRQTK